MEIEAKFYVRDLDRVRRLLEDMGAVQVQSRVHETNLRFDTPDGQLSRALKVLRLRQDTAAHLTYKGPGDFDQGVRAREEIEFILDDFEAARRLLEALGYRVSMAYEKYRTVYALDGAHVMLDEMPFGRFVEIEAGSPGAIRSMADALGLDWECRSAEGYTALFRRARSALGLVFNDLTFANFEGVRVDPDALGMRPADSEG